MQDENNWENMCRSTTHAIVHKYRHSITLGEWFRWAVLLDHITPGLHAVFTASFIAVSQINDIEASTGTALINCHEHFIISKTTRNNTFQGEYSDFKASWQL